MCAHARAYVCVCVRARVCVRGVWVFVCVGARACFPVRKLGGGGGGEREREREKF